MKIETKFNIGDKCWLIHQNILKECTIKSISILCTAPEKYYEEYTLNEIKTGEYKNLYPYFTKVFKTKEELIASL